MALRKCNSVLTANRVPDHQIDTFPNAGNPNTISVLTVAAEYSLVPVQTATIFGGPTAYVLNGVLLILLKLIY